MGISGAGKDDWKAGLGAARFRDMVCNPVARSTRR
jgi:hypothetical protein